MNLKKKTKYVYRLWPLQTFSKAPAYLEAMETQGLRFHHMCALSNLAAFERLEPQGGEPPVYCWDYFDVSVRAEIQEYLDLCEASGWEIAWQFGRHKLFRIKDGRQPVAIREETEYGKMLFRRAARPELFAGSMMLLIVALFRWISADELFAFTTLFFTTQLYIGASVVTGTTAVLWLFYQGFRDAWKAGKYKGGDREAIAVEVYTKRKIIGLTSLALALYAGVIALFILFILAAGAGIPRNYGSIIIFAIMPFSVWRSYIAANVYVGWNEEEKKKKTSMKGIRPVKTNWFLFAAIVILLIGVYFGMGRYLDGRLPELSGSNLFCDRVYTENRENAIGNMYWQAKSEACRDMVLNGVFQKEFMERDDTPVTPDRRDAREALEETVVSRELLAALQSGKWDAVYDGGYFYTVICRGKEIWCIVDLEDAKDAVGVGEFLEKTGF